MSAELAPAVIDYLVAQAQASPQLGQASPLVVVLDGPQITDDTLAGQLHLWIGHDPVNPSGPAAQATQDWPDLDAGIIDEQGEITCTAEAWSGTAVMKTQRDTCKAIVSAVALMLRGSPAQPGSGPGDTTMGGLVFWSWVAAGAWYQATRPYGISVMHVFSVRYYGRTSAS